MDLNQYLELLGGLDGYNTPEEIESEDESVDILDNTDLTEEDWEELNRTFDMPAPPNSTPVTTPQESIGGREMEALCQNLKDTTTGNRRECNCDCAGCENKEIETSPLKGTIFQIRSSSSFSADTVRRLGALTPEIPIRICAGQYITEV